MIIVVIFIVHRHLGDRTGRACSKRGRIEKFYIILVENLKEGTS